MSVTYLTTPIVEVRHDPPPHGSGMTREGYTKRSGAPTSRMIRLQGEKRWRRLMVWQFSNLGTLFVNLDGKPHVVREETLPKEGTVSSHATRKKPSGHATKKKSSVQLDREIAEALSRSDTSAPRATMIKGRLVVPHGYLTDYKTGEQLRPATAAEARRSRAAAKRDGGSGVIKVDGLSTYVSE